MLLLASLARKRKDDPASLDYQHQAEAAADDVLSRRSHWPRDFPDDNIWHLATVGEAYLLKRNWAEAVSHYGEALSATNLQPFHRQSIGKQAVRILEALKLLERNRSRRSTSRRNYSNCFLEIAISFC